MPKKKSSSSIQVNEAIIICHRNGVKIYPVSRLGFWYVQVEYNGRTKRIDKPIGAGATLSTHKPNFKNVNWIEAINKTYIHYAEIIKKGTNGTD